MLPARVGRALLGRVTGQTRALARTALPGWSRGMAVGSMVKLEKNLEKRYAVLTMQRAPVNSLNSDMCHEITAAIKEAEYDKDIHGLILTSGCDNVFSAGLDLKEIIKPDAVRVRAFWHAMQGLYMSLYGTRLATVAAINGSAPAAGLLLAMSCEHRVMAPGFSTGLNEVKFGLVAPSWFVHTLIQTVGNRQAEKLLLRGDLIPSEEALRIGLVDQVVPLEDVMATAEAELFQMIACDPEARAETKEQLRGDAVDALDKRSNREQDQDWFVDFAMQESTQNHLEKYIATLKARSAKPAA
mmetsp:Transcript_14389/g.33255  ORF Transcript_14389/g.33255 Transcript_14389/m.33255 type:complete len:299 (+) Transcript_14389:22-918(+)